MTTMPKELQNIFKRVEKEKLLLPEEYIHPDSKEIFIDTGLLWIKYKDNPHLIQHSAIHLVLDLELNYFKEINEILNEKYNIPKIEFKDITNKRPKILKNLNKIDIYYTNWFNYFSLQIDTILNNVFISYKDDLIQLAIICNNKLKSIKRFKDNKVDTKLWIYEVLEEFIMDLKDHKFLPIQIHNEIKFEGEQVSIYQIKTTKTYVSKTHTKIQPIKNNESFKIGELNA